MSKLRLEVILDVLDKASAPLRKLKAGTQAASKGTADLADKLKQLQKQQRTLDALGEGKTKLAELAKSLQLAQAQLAGMQAGGQATSAQMRQQQQTVERLSQSYARQKAQLVQTRSALTRMGVGNASTAQAQLRSIKTSACGSPLQNQSRPPHQTQTPWAIQANF